MQNQYLPKRIVPSRNEIYDNHGEYYNPNGQLHIDPMRKGATHQRGMTMVNQTQMYHSKPGPQRIVNPSVHLPPIHNGGAHHHSMILQDRRSMPMIQTMDDDHRHENQKQLMNLPKTPKVMMVDGMQGANRYQGSQRSLHNNYIQIDSQSDLSDKTPTGVGNSQKNRSQTHLLQKHHGMSISTDPESFPDIHSGSYSVRSHKSSTMTPIVKRSLDELPEYKNRHHTYSHTPTNSNHHSHGHNYGFHGHGNHHRHHHHHHAHLEEEDEDEEDDDSDTSVEEEIVIIKTHHNNNTNQPGKIKKLQRKGRSTKKDLDEEDDHHKGHGRSHKNIDENHHGKNNGQRQEKGGHHHGKHHDEEEEDDEEEEERHKSKKKKTLKVTKKEKIENEKVKKQEDAKMKERKNIAHHKLRAFLWAIGIPSIGLSISRAQVKRVKIARKELSTKIENAVCEIEEFCLHQASKELSHVFKEVKHSFQFVSIKNPPSESKISVMGEALENVMSGVFDKLSSNSNKLSDNFFSLIGDISENDSVIPANFLTECELKRLPMSRYATLDKPVEWCSKLMILSIIIRGFISKVLAKGLQTKDSEKIINISSVVYLAAMDVLKSNTPVFAKNQKNVHNDLKLAPKEPEKSSLRLTVFDTEDPKNEILLGFYSKQDFAPVQKIRRSLFEVIKVGISGWLEKIYQVSHNRWLSIARPPKRERPAKKNRSTSVL